MSKSNVGFVVFAIVGGFGGWLLFNHGLPGPLVVDGQTIGFGQAIDVVEGVYGFLYHPRQQIHVPAKRSMAGGMASAGVPENVIQVAMDSFGVALMNASAQPPEPPTSVDGFSIMLEATPLSRGRGCQQASVRVLGDGPQQPDIKYGGIWCYSSVGWFVEPESMSGHSCKTPSLGQAPVGCQDTFRARPPNTPVAATTIPGGPVITADIKKQRGRL